MHPLTIWALFAILSASPTLAASDGEAMAIFGDGFEACCTVGGTVSGLAGSGLVLRLTAGAVQEDRAIAGNGPWRFTAPLTAGVAWSVGIQAQPTAGPHCRVATAGGTMGTTHIDNVAVHCADSLQWDAGDWGQLWQ